MIKFNRVLPLVLSLTLTGCSLAPTYQRPEAPVAAGWGDAAGHAGPSVEQMQWQAFIVDPVLRQLIASALDNNRSLRQTLLDIEQARAQYRIQRADRVPGLNASAAGNRQHLPSALSNDGREGVTSTYQVGLSLPEYEVDLFGRVKNLSDAALEQYLATEEVGRAARIALIAEVSQAYLALDGAERRQALTRQTLTSREDSLALVVSVALPARQRRWTIRRRWGWSSSLVPSSKSPCASSARPTTRCCCCWAAPRRPRRCPLSARMS